MSSAVVPAVATYRVLPPITLPPCMSRTRGSTAGSHPKITELELTGQGLKTQKPSREPRPTSKQRQPAHRGDVVGTPLARTTEPALTPRLTPARETRRRRHRDTVR